MSNTKQVLPLHLSEITFQEKQPIKRKFLPQKINFADICEDGPPACKNRKVEKNCNATSTSNTGKVVFKPFRMTITAADLEDTPPLGKPKRKIKKVGGTTGKDCIKKTLVPAKTTFNQKTGNRSSASAPSAFLKPKKKAIKPIKTVRKELFSGSQNNANRSSVKQIPVVQMGATVKSPNLNYTQPLIRMSDLQLELFQSSLTFKHQFENDVPLKEKFKFTKVLPIKSSQREVTVFKNTGAIKKQRKFSAPFIADTELDNFTTVNNQHYVNTSESLNVSDHQFNVSSVSPAENEFIENETRCKNGNYNDNSNLKQLSDANHNTTDEKENINNDILRTVLHNHLTHFKNLQENFLSLQQKFKIFCDEFQADIELFQGEIQNYQEYIVKNINKVTKVLKNDKDKFVMDNEWHISTEGTRNVSFSENTSTVKKSVAFDLKSDHLSLKDDGLEKSVNVYNSLRKSYKNLLDTPKLDRKCLQTPKRHESNQRDSVSRKVQKQCLLLVDTPTSKNNKIL